MVERSELLLASDDEDRARTAARLRRAADEGRLPTDEFDERLGQALRARTYGELDAIVADLPAETGLRRRRRHARLAALRAPPAERFRSARIALFRHRGRALIVGVIATTSALAGMCVNDQPPYGQSRVQ